MWPSDQRLEGDMTYRNRVHSGQSRPAEQHASKAARQNQGKDNAAAQQQGKETPQHQRTRALVLSQSQAGNSNVMPHLNMEILHSNTPTNTRMEQQETLKASINPSLFFVIVTFTAVILVLSADQPTKKTTRIIFYYELNKHPSQPRNYGKVI